MTANRFATLPRMPRVPRQPPSPFTVTRHPTDARPLITTCDPPDGDVGQAVLHHGLKPPIVRVRPQAEHDDEHVRNVKGAWEELGAHVRVLAREHVPVEAVVTVVPEENASPRAVVLAVAGEVRSAAPDALVQTLNTVMDEVGL